MDWAVGGFQIPGFGVWTLVMVLVIVWSIFWKGVALWKSAREDSRFWFVAFLLINTFGILEILYLFVFSKGFSINISEKMKTGHHSHEDKSRDSSSENS